MEKNFFLKAFQGTTLTFILPASDHLENRSLQKFTLGLQELASAGVHGLILFQDVGQAAQRLKSGLSGLMASDSWLHQECEGPALFGALWESRRPFLGMGLREADYSEFLSAVSRRIAPLRLSRLLVMDPEGGLKEAPGRQVISYVNARQLSPLVEEAPQNRRGLLLAFIQNLLTHGAGGISLCRLEDVSRELFTFEGCGTFFSKHHYCRVRRLGFDDFSEMAAIMQRGEVAGYLLPRNQSEMLDVLTGGYGAFFGDDHLAGVCGLLTAPYADVNVGELVSLITLGRFQGEGVGRQLVFRIKRDGRRRGLKTLFACTRSPQVVDFFQSCGFRVLDPGSVPEQKWQGYDQERKLGLTCLGVDLSWD
ncbi:MAG: GNAT family N-acetyltransferase [Magnetococcales bacterium]|nr:GNAT family N-acetyltransferase [Magnetococcales bacterium]